MWRPQQYLNFPISPSGFTQKCFVKMFQTAVVYCHIKGRFPGKKKKVATASLPPQRLMFFRYLYLVTCDFMACLKVLQQERRVKQVRRDWNTWLEKEETCRGAGNKMYAVFHRIQWGGILINSTSLAKFTSHRWCALRANIMGGWLFLSLQ